MRLLLNEQGQLLSSHKEVYCWQCCLTRAARLSYLKLVLFEDELSREGLGLTLGHRERLLLLVLKVDHCAEDFAI